MTKIPADDGASDAPAHDDEPSGTGATGASSAPEPPDVTEAQTVLDLLAEGVPMALVADLIDPAGPPSPVILEEEGLPTEAWWAPNFSARRTGAKGPDVEPETDVDAPEPESDV